jgi:hypothetical protein
MYPHLANEIEDLCQRLGVPGLGRLGPLGREHLACAQNMPCFVHPLSVFESLLQRNIHPHTPVREGTSNRVLA